MDTRHEKHAKAVSIPCVTFLVLFYSARRELFFDLVLEENKADLKQVGS
jgi:hypothetical protein